MHVSLMRQRTDQWTDKQVRMMQVHTTHDACIHDACIHDACTHHACTHHAFRKDVGMYDACISDSRICDASQKWGRTDRQLYL